jgi:hypothetical protein
LFTTSVFVDLSSLTNFIWPIYIKFHCALLYSIYNVRLF